MHLRCVWVCVRVVVQTCSNCHTILEPILDHSIYRGTCSVLVHMSVDLASAYVYESLFKWNANAIIIFNFDFKLGRGQWIIGETFSKRCTLVVVSAQNARLSTRFDTRKCNQVESASRGTGCHAINSPISIFKGFHIIVAFWFRIQCVDPFTSARSVWISEIDARTKYRELESCI